MINGKMGYQNYQGSNMINGGMVSRIGTSIYQGNQEYFN